MDYILRFRKTVLEVSHLKKVKIFTTNNKRMIITQDKINEWIEQENINIESLSVTSGSMYSSRIGSVNLDEVEIFITILYSKES
ncbi:hypothetical protein D3C87_80410 [compost metagenome]